MPASLISYVSVHVRGSEYVRLPLASLGRLVTPRIIDQVAADAVTSTDQ